ncbi:MAG: hypothetical protein OCC49_16565 [Fibrobacterales bacterium]
MNKLYFILILVFSNVHASDFSINLGTSSPSKGMIGFEYYFLNKTLSSSLYFGSYENEYGSLGVSVTYHPFVFNGPYAFHSWQWVAGHGTVNGIDLSHNNYWRIIYGVGYQYAFFSHFGVYAEVGIDSYVGKEGYFLGFDKDTGELNNNFYLFPIGLGIMFPF